MSKLRPIPAEKFRRWLRMKDMQHIRTTKHEVYDNPDHPLLRPCTIHCGVKEVPILHIKTTLNNINASYGTSITIHQFLEEIKDL